MPLSPLKEVHGLISRACEMVSDMAKGLSRWDYVKGLVMGRFSWIVLVNPMESQGPCKREARGQSRRETQRCLALGLEEGATSRGLQGLEKDEGWILPWSPSGSRAWATPRFSLGETHVGLGTSRTIGYYIRVL